MRKLIKILSILGVLMLFGSCSSSKSVVNTVTGVPDGKISIKIEFDRSSFLGIVNPIAPDDVNSDLDIKLQNLSLGEEAKPVALGQNIIVDYGQEFEITGTYDLVGGGYNAITPSRFSATIYNSTSRTLKVTIKANVIGGVVGGTRITYNPQ